MTTTTAPTKREAPAWELYLGQVLARRNTISFAATRQALARGISDTTEHYAIPHLAPLKDPKWGELNETGYMRAVALAAIHHNAPQVETDGTYHSLGRGLAAITKATTGQWPQAEEKNRDSIAVKVALLPNCDLESAVRLFDSMLSQASSRKNQIPINFYDLARTLTYWGNGYNDASVRTRRAVLSDYFGASRRSAA